MAGNQNLVAKIIINAQDNASKAFDGIRENAGKLAAALATVLSVDFFKSAVDSAADFEEQLTITGVKAGATSEDLLKLKTAAIEIGNEFGKTGTESLKGLEIIASAGYKTEESISLLAPAFALADNSGKTLTESSSNLIKIMQSLGLDTKQAANVTDILTVASSQANTKVGDLTDALLESGGIAKTFGLGIKDTAATLDVLAAAGKSGATAGVALRNILLEIHDPASKTTEELKKLGIHSTDISTVFKELAKKGQAGADALLALNKGDIAAANGMLENIGKYDQFRKGLEGIDGAAKNASDALGENFKAAYEDLGALWDNLKTQLGTPILEPFKNAVVGLQNKIKELTDSGVIDNIGKALASAFNAGATVFSEYAKTIDFTTIGEKVKSFAIATAATFNEISAGAKAVYNTFSLASNSVSTLVSGLQTTAAAMLGAVSYAVGGVTKSFGDFLLLIGKVGDYMPGFNLLGESTKSLGEYFSKAGQAGMDFAKALKDEATVQANQTAESATKAANAFNSLTESASQTAPKLAAIWEQTNNVTQSLGECTQAEAQAAQQAENLANSANKSAATQENHAQKIYKTTDALGKISYSTQQFAGSTEVAITKTSGLISTLDNVKDKKTTITADTKQPEEKIAELKKETESTHKVDPATATVDAKIEDLKKQTNSTHNVDVDNSRPEQAIRNNRQDTSSNHTIYVHTVHTVQANQNGGQIQYFADGGKPQYNFQRREGGLGGYGGGDTVPAMLEPGEWIIKKESVQKYGDGFMAKLNAGQIEDLPKFATGGGIVFNGTSNSNVSDEQELANLTASVVNQVVTLDEWNDAQDRIKKLTDKISAKKATTASSASSKTSTTPASSSSTPQKQNEEITINFKFQNGASAHATASPMDAKTIVEALREAANRGISI